jgi:hypothetical protein
MILFTKVLLSSGFTKVLFKTINSHLSKIRSEQELLAKEICSNELDHIVLATSVLVSKKLIRKGWTK